MSSAKSDGLINTQWLKYIYKVRHFLTFVVGITTIIAGWTFWPPLIHPYVRIPGNNITLHLDCIAQQLDFESKTHNISLKRSSVVIPAVAVQLPPDSWPLKSSVNETDKDSTVQLRLDPDDPFIQPFTNGQGITGEVEYNIFFHRIPFIDIQSVSIKAPRQLSKPWCKQAVIEGSELLKKLKAKDAKVMHYYLIQEELSNLVLQVNEFVGNIVLAGMLIALFWLLYIFTNGLNLLVISPDSKLKEQIEIRLKQLDPALAKQGSIEIISADYILLHRRLVLARVLGPAFGFALTVSSLIAALHPAVQAEQDAFRFISSLQIAMVATLVGLIIRIVAEFGISVNRAAADRTIAIFASTTNKQSTEGQNSQSN